MGHLKAALSFSTSFLLFKDLPMEIIFHSFSFYFLTKERFNTKILLSFLLNKSEEMSTKLRATHICIDFEIAIYMVFQRKLPWITIKGYLFHLTQSR